VDIVDRPTDFTRWRAIVLPGQGAFGDSVNNLRRQGFERPLLDAVEGGLPLLGICVGMQLLFDASEEMGEHEGLHLIPGAVRRFPDTMPDPTHPGRSLRVPQIGWNTLTIRRHDPLVADVPDGAHAYFAHSYYCDAAAPDRRVGRRPITASTTPAWCAIATPGASSRTRKRATPLGCASWATSCAWLPAWLSTPRRSRRRPRPHHNGTSGKRGCIVTLRRAAL
jgi:imidazole glycerol phosphate synthase glutamine amidotransferase subunit